MRWGSIKRSRLRRLGGRSGRAVTGCSAVPPGRIFVRHAYPHLKMRAMRLARAPGHSAFPFAPLVLLFHGLFSACAGCLRFGFSILHPPSSIFYPPSSILLVAASMGVYSRLKPFPKNPMNRSKSHLIVVNPPWPSGRTHSADWDEMLRVVAPYVAEMLHLKSLTINRVTGVAGFQTM